MSRDLPAPAAESFREWWRRTRGPAPAANPPPRPATRAASAAAAGQAGTAVGAGAGGDARADILDRIRAAVGPAAAADVPRNYRTRDLRPRDEIVTLFAERVAEYRATVHRVSVSATTGAGEGAVAGAVADVVRSIAHEAGVRRIGIPADLEPAWRPEGASRPEAALPPEGPHASASGPRGLELVEDRGLSVQQLDELDGALTGCAVAIAETGTFVLDCGRGQGRRALTLVPDLHVCVVREDQVVGLVPEAVGELADAVRAGRPLTFVSGPSATSDIELDRVEGVHGPRVLHVVLVA
jgi:L-lactate dehydrogenase complex protein LldG